VRLDDLKQQLSPHQHLHLFKQHLATGLLSLAGVLRIRNTDLAHRAGSFASSTHDGRKVYRTREDARADVFDHIERFYNPLRKHWKLNFLSPLHFEGLKG
jgi:transposase InsO family protein